MNGFDSESFKKLEDTMKKMQEQINAKSYKGQSGGGIVEATVNGKGDILSLKIDVPPSDLQSKDDVKTLSDLIVAAVKKAQESSASSIVDNMGSIFGGENAMPDINELMELTKNLSKEVDGLEKDDKK